VTLPVDAVMNSNRRIDAHPRVRPVKSRRIRDRFAAVARGTDQIPSPVEVVVQLTFGRRGRRDSPNWYPTIKAAIDGLVDAGALGDDSDEHIHQTRFNAHDVDPVLRAPGTAGVRVAITVTEVAPASIPEGTRP